MDGGKFVFTYQVSNIPNIGAYANFLKFLGKFKIPTLPLLLFQKKSLSIRRERNKINGYLYIPLTSVARVNRAHLSFPIRWYTRK